MFGTSDESHTPTYKASGSQADFYNEVRSSVTAESTTAVKAGKQLCPKFLPLMMHTAYFSEKTNIGSLSIRMTHYLLHYWCHVRGLETDCTLCSLKLIITVIMTYLLSVNL